MILKLNEGNPVSHELPSSIDSFLQDVAQTTGQINYNDIAKFAKSKFTSEDLKALRKLRREYFDPEIDPWDDDTFNEIGKKVAMIVKKKVNEELIDESVDASSLERYVNGQALPSYGEDVIYDNIDASEACDAVEYMYGLKSKREALNMIHSGEVSKEEILKAIEFYNLKDLPPSVRTKLFRKESLVENSLKDGYEVKQVSFDVAVPKGTKLSYGQGRGNSKFAEAIEKACESLGYVRAGDEIDGDIDLTDIYRANGFDEIWNGEF